MQNLLSMILVRVVVKCIGLHYEPHPVHIYGTSIVTCMKVCTRFMNYHAVYHSLVPPIIRSPDPPQSGHYSQRGKTSCTLYSSI